MLKNTFKTIVRNLLRNKGYSILNISGLAIGIACAWLMGLIFFRLVSSDFIQTSGMHVWAGHDFTGTVADTTSVIVNRVFANMIDTNGVVGKILQSGRELPKGKFKNMRIIGVVDDYQFGGVYAAGVPPLIFFATRQPTFGKTWLMCA